MDYHKTLFIDLETTGLIPEIQAPKARGKGTKTQKLSYETHYMQYPYIVSIAWKIDDEDIKEYIIHQEGREIPMESSNIHKITTEIAEESGQLFQNIISALIVDAKDCEIVVGHGIYFDTSIIKANILREVSRDKMPSVIYNIMTEILHKNKRIDLMRSTAKMMRKWPTLQELHMKIFRRGFEEHVAKNDVEAIYNCYNWLLKKGIVPTWEKLQEKAQENSRQGECIRKKKV